MASRPSVAIVHDWLTVVGGAERVLGEMISLYPEADLFTVIDFLPEKERGFLLGRPVTTSFIQHLPLARRHYRQYLPLMGIAVEQFDLTGYDLVISSSFAVAKGVLTGPDQVHISYVHSPMRYAWDLQHQYLATANLDHGLKSVLARWLLHKMRLWDVRTINGVDRFIANSHFIARRIRRVYGRPSVVIHPPVDLGRFALVERKEDYYVTVSRLVPYKRVDLIAETFSRTPDRRLVIIGDGPEMKKVRAAAGPNVEIRGYQPDTVVRDVVSRARAFIFAAEEDFGISIVEAQACGTPVILYGKGGGLESVRGPGKRAPTGVFFDRQTPESLLAALAEFEASPARFTPAACRANAERFSVSRFRERLALVTEYELSRLRNELASVGGGRDQPVPESIVA